MKVGILKCYHVSFEIKAYIESAKFKSTPEAIVIFTAVSKQSVSKRGILKSPISHVLNSQVQLTLIHMGGGDDHHPRL